MTNEISVPFGGVKGWLADLTVSSRRQKAGRAIDSYFVAVADERSAMAAIRSVAKVDKDAALAPRRALSLRDLQRLGMKTGQVKLA